VTKPSTLLHTGTLKPEAPLPLVVDEPAGAVALAVESPSAVPEGTAEARGTLDAAWHWSELFDGVDAFADRVRSAH
jgi:hypothetical protein